MKRIQQKKKIPINKFVYSSFSNKKLKQDFFERETIQVAIDLLGCTLVRMTAKGIPLKGKIVETEAYLGREDSCSHSYGGRKTERTQVMYLSGGHAYVYFTYGMHHCFNIVTEKKGNPEAVLIRALEPLEGISLMRKNRKQKEIQNLTSGPGKLCQALQINRDLSGKSFLEDVIYVESGEKILPHQIVTSERIGLSPYQSACFWPLRFYIKNNFCISRV